MAYGKNRESFDRKIANIDVSEKLRIGMLSQRISTSDIMVPKRHISKNTKSTYRARYNLLEEENIATVEDCILPYILLHVLYLGFSSGETSEVGLIVRLDFMSQLLSEIYLSTLKTSQGKQ